AQAHLSRLENKIDAVVSELYGLDEEDYHTLTGDEEWVSQQIIEPSEANSSELVDIETAEPEASVNSEELAVRWISYAVGIILGRFQPGIPGALGSAVYRRSDFAIGSLPEPTEEEFDELVGPGDIYDLRFTN